MRRTKAIASRDHPPRRGGSSCWRPISRTSIGTAECPVIMAALGTPVTAEAFAIANEPAPGPAAVGAARLRATVHRAAPNRFICTRCGDSARPLRDANIRRSVCPHRAPRCCAADRHGHRSTPQCASSHAAQRMNMRTFNARYSGRTGRTRSGERSGWRAQADEHRVALERLHARFIGRLLPCCATGSRMTAWWLLPAAADGTTTIRARGVRAISISEFASVSLAGREGFGLACQE